MMPFEFSEMKRRTIAAWCSRLLATWVLVSAATSPLGAQVELIRNGDAQIDIRINGEPFSSYYFGPAVPKPFLSPLRTASGIVITRRYPMEEVAGESHDHQHHRGLWIGYGEINGFNFWENEFHYRSDQPPKYDPAKLGTIALVRINELNSGRSSGDIDGLYQWVDPHRAVLLEEHRVLTFYAQSDVRTIDVSVTLTAKRAVHFGDTKEGFFGMRLADSMTEKSGGVITNSEGAQTEKDVWGKRANWVDYNGTVGGQKIGVAIFDAPENFNHPTRWHARAYGLFAANPFGYKDFEPRGTGTGGHELRPGESLHFRYRILIHSGDLPKKAIDQAYADFAK